MTSFYHYFFMYPKGNLFIPAPHGQLEAIYRPENHLAERVALVLHPHPMGGGTMHNKVVFRAARALFNAGFEVLRFNFRGVGNSTGVFDEGAGEVIDARIALDYLLSKQPRAKEVIIAGFSFGSAIGLRLGCADKRVNRLIAIGAPAKMHERATLLNCTKPKLFIHGMLDEIAPLAPIEALIESLPAENNSYLIKIEGAGHFFDDTLDALMEIITDFAAEKN